MPRAPGRPKGSHDRLPRVPAPRMSAKVRTAANLIARQGMTVREAAARAGMNESALSRALHRDGMQQWLESQKALFCLEVDSLKDQAKRLAVLEGMRLMRESQSDQVRARMVEFFASEAGKASLVTVNIGAKGSGYEYVPPGSQVIDITPATDSESVGDGEEGEE